MKRIIAGMWVTAVALWAGMAWATDYTWTGGGDGKTWESAANWGGSGYPSGAGDTALINSGAASTSITNSGNLTLGALTLDTGFSGTNSLGGSLTLSTASGGSGNLTVNAGRLQTVKGTVGGITVAETMAIGSAGAVVVRRSSTTAQDAWGTVVGAGQTITVKNLVVDGSLNADGQGFDAGQGPSPGNENRGGSHGGRGHGGDMFVTSGSPYGSVTNPVALGSGGNSGSVTPGGGAIVLVVDNALTNNGIISARGANQNEFGTGDRVGAGGSLHITAATLAGTGIVQAVGGSSPSYLGGGGGRIAVVLTNQNDFGSVRFQAFGGLSGGKKYATAGTVYRKHAGHGTGLGELVIDNNGASLETRNGYTELSTGGDVVQDFAQVVITNKGNLAIRTNDTLNFNTATNIVGYGPTNSVVTLVGVAGVTFPNPFTLSTNYALRIDAPVNASEHDWTVPAGAVLSHSPNYIVDTNRLQLTLRNLTIENNGAIDATSKGFYQGRGPGMGTSTESGGSHGGGGGSNPYTNSLGIATNTYGSVTNPITLGSGGRYNMWNSSGGGAVILTIANALTNNGRISARATNKNELDGTSDRLGAGGSVNIMAATLSGSGTVLANGGAGFRCGGGGRIAVRLTSGTSFGSIAFQAYGGSSDSKGAAGTVYLESATDGAGMGTVTVANSNVTASGSGAITALPAFAGATENLSKTKWTVYGNGKIALVTNVTVGELTVATNGYVELAGWTLTLNSLSITGRQVAAETYSTSQLGSSLVTDVSPGAVGRVVVLPQTQYGTVIAIR